MSEIAENQLTLERERANQERERANQLAQKLRDLGINPDEIS
jgi:hypothetical protein